jgi:hypothetical protein
VRPIARPVLLRYQTVPDFRFRLDAQGRFANGSSLKPYSLSTEGSGSLERRGSFVDWSLRVASMTIEGRRIQASAPLVEFKVRTDLLGEEIDAPEIETRGLKELAIDADPNDLSGPVDAWTAYPESAVKAGDLIAAMRVEGILPLPDDSPVRNTIAVVARGLTNIGGREFLLGQITGAVEARHTQGFLVAQAGGYWLIDVATGLHSGRVRLDVSVGGGSSGRQTGVVTADFDYRPS